MLITANFGSARTGLATVGYKILNADKSQYAARTITGVTELGGGVYGVQVANSDLAGRYVVWDSGQTPAVYAAEGFGAVLADDAITAAKFDESTAFPLKSADTGATAVARTGADADTLETLSDELVAMKGATFDGSTDSLEAVRNRGDAAWKTATGFSTHSPADVKTALEAAGSHLTLVKAKTDNLPASPAATGDKMDLVDAPNATALTAVRNAVQAAGSTLATLLSRILGTLAAGTHTAQSGDAYARLGTPSGASIAADVATRLAAADYTAPPSASTIAAAVRDVNNTFPAADSLGEAINTNVDEAAIAADVVARLGAGAITVTTPVSVGGETIELVQGDDYRQADGRALSWSSEDWPDLTGATVALNIETAADVVSITCTVPTAGAGAQTIEAELTTAETGALSLGNHRFDLKAVLVSTHVVTLVLGTCRVVADVG